MTILPAAYFGSIEYFAYMIQHGDSVVVDCHENYIKRSCRNRTEIISANGPLVLSVQVCNANRPRTPMTEMEIDYSKDWQHQHWNAIVSAYHTAPYFELFEDHFKRFFTTRYQSLLTLNTDIIREIHAFLRTEPRFLTSENYIQASAADIDLRPKKREQLFVAPMYFQLFSDRMPFISNPSVIDLLMSEGPEAIAVLNSCRL